MSRIRFKTLPVIILLAGSLLRIPLVIGQSPAQEKDDVVKVFTELVQTDVMVLDKDNHFINGLKREDFEIKIDGKVREIQSIDRIVAGTGRERALLTGARSATQTSSSAPEESVTERKQTALFFIDDYHMDLSGIAATQKAINNFIEKDMTYNTEAGIACATSQLGFLQQITDNKTVLRTALSRLRERYNPVNDPQPPAMREVDALLIDRGDADVVNYFVEQTMAQNPGMTRDTALAIVGERATTVLGQAAIITKRTLAGLEQMIEMAGKSPGRKILFLFSNGCFLDHRNSDASERTQLIISDAARNGVVIYSIDARGLVASLTDASTPPTRDPTQRLERGTRTAVWAAQEIMNLVAKDTGGRLIANTNDLSAGLQRSLDEVSTYYLVGWKPEPGTPEPGKFRKISVSVLGHPDYTVRVRRGFYSENPPAVAANEKKSPDTTPGDPVAAAMQKALVDPSPRQDLPIAITLNYLNSPDKGVTLSTSVQFSRDAVSFTWDPTGKSSGTVSIAGVIFDDKGHAGAKLSDRLTLQTEAKENDADAAGAIVSTYTLRIGPGLYQVRVAARDQASGRIGTANAWIEIPDLASPKLALSSLIVGGGRQARSLTPTSQRNAVDSVVGLNVDHHYVRDSTLRFLVFAYNAKPAPSTAKPTVTIQVEILQNEKTVVSSPAHPISTDGVEDLKRLPYAADISLAGLGKGHYQLRVTAVDEIGKGNAAKEWQFQID